MALSDTDGSELQLEAFYDYMEYLDRALSKKRICKIDEFMVKPPAAFFIPVKKLPDTRWEVIELTPENVDCIRNDEPPTHRIVDFTEVFGISAG